MSKKPEKDKRIFLSKHESCIISITVRGLPEKSRKAPIYVIYFTQQEKGETMQKHRKFIGDKRFYLMVLGVAMPIMIQNGITNFVSLLDNIMVGQVGTEQMSGVAIVNQLLLSITLHFRRGIRCRNFHCAVFRQGNDEGVRNTFRFKLWIGVILTAAAITIFLGAHEPLIRLYLTGDQEART